MVEYGLILGLVTLVAVGALTAVASEVDGIYDIAKQASDAIQGALGGG